MTPPLIPTTYTIVDGQIEVSGSRNSLEFYSCPAPTYKALWELSVCFRIFLQVFSKDL